MPSISFSELKLPSPVSQLNSPLLSEKQVQLFIKRDELIHPVLQGNKWRKLKYNLIAANKTARENRQNTILSFGGPYSNHLHALAYAGKQFGFNTIGIVRGEQPQPINSCIQDMLNWGMQLNFIKRVDYKQKTSPVFLQTLKEQFGDFYLIPEGGNNALGKKGCGELLDELDQGYDVICCEVGSGTMLSSLIENNKNLQNNILGFVVMKNINIEIEIRNSINPDNVKNNKWSLSHDYHFNGFAKASNELHQFILNFKQQFNIQLEPVYSGKMLYGIFDLIKKDYFKPHSKILAIHGGGLQGLRGFSEYSEINFENTKSP